MSNPTLDNYYTTAINMGLDSRMSGNLALVGIVKGHPRKADGKKIQTSSVDVDEGATGRTVVTASGTVYELLTPDPEWVKWMKENDIPFDPENPIRVLKDSDV